MINKSSIAILALCFFFELWGEDLDYTVHWIGNSYSGKDGWVLQDGSDIHVTAEGNLFTNVFWDEGGGNVQQYDRDGRLVNIAMHTHGWGCEGGSAVTANKKYLFFIQARDNEGGGLCKRGDSWPPKGFKWFGVSRRDINNIRKSASFDGGRGNPKHGDVLERDFLPVVECEENLKGTQLSGIAATDERLYVSSPFHSSIRIYDAETMKYVGSWKLARPYRIALDLNDNLWALQSPDTNGSGWRVVGFNSSGAQVRNFKLDDYVIASDLCFDNKNRLLIADKSIKKQILIYDDIYKKPRLVAKFGKEYGILAPPAGKVRPLHFNEPQSVGVDAEGRIYVLSGKGTVIECYSPDGKLLWSKYGLMFVDGLDVDLRTLNLENCSVDVFSKEERFTFNWKSEPGKSWTYKAYTIDRKRYPDDPRIQRGGSNAWIRVLQGQRILFVTVMHGHFFQVYRFDPQGKDEIAIPAALFSKKDSENRKTLGPSDQPDNGEWIWIDNNGNGSIDADEYLTNDGQMAGDSYWPDDVGNIWHVKKNKICAFSFQGFNKFGVPQWNFDSLRTYEIPKDLDQVRRVKYDPKRDIMVLGGNRGEHKNQHWKPMGPVLAVYDNWSTNNPKLRWTIVLDYEKSHGKIHHISHEPMSVEIAGDYLFVSYTRGLQEQGIKEAFVRILNLNDGSYVGNLIHDKELGSTGLLDIPEPMRAIELPNGDFLVFLEDDAKAKVIAYHWRPKK